MGNTGQKSKHSELSFARHYNLANEKLDLHFRRNGTIEIPAETEASQVGKFTTDTTKSKKHVRNCDRRTRGR
jgi:hypothetical protein